MFHGRRLAWFLIATVLVPSGIAQKKNKPDDQGMILPPVVTEKKKKKEDVTQPAPARIELPAALVAETDRLAFHVTPLSSKGLLSQQTREALQTILRNAHAGTVVKLRAFVAGSGDLRRIGEIAGELFAEKHQPLPVLTAVQVGALPMEGAQVVIEDTTIERSSVNPNGLAFFPLLAANNVKQSIDQIAAIARTDSLDVLRVTCMVSSLDAEQDATRFIAGTFPDAAVNVIQMQRGPANPPAQCEAVTRLTTPAQTLTGAVVVNSPKLILTSAQLTFGSSPAELEIGFDRIQRLLSNMRAVPGEPVVLDAYSTSLDLIPDLRKLAIKANIIPCEALPSLDATIGIDAIAVQAQ